MEILLIIQKRKKIFTDRIILSKGHATSALYPILRDFGNFKKIGITGALQKKVNQEFLETIVFLALT